MELPNGTGSSKVKDEKERRLDGINGMDRVNEIKIRRQE